MVLESIVRRVIIFLSVYKIIGYDESSQNTNDLNSPYIRLWFSMGQCRHPETETYNTTSIAREFICFFVGEMEHIGMHGMIKRDHQIRKSLWVRGFGALSVVCTAAITAGKCGGAPSAACTSLACFESMIIADRCAQRLGSLATVPLPPGAGGHRHCGRGCQKQSPLRAMGHKHFKTEIAYSSQGEVGPDQDGLSGPPSGGGSAQGGIFGLGANFRCQQDGWFGPWNDGGPTSLEVPTSSGGGV